MRAFKHILKCVLGLAIGLVISTTYSVSSVSAQTPILVSLMGNSQLTSTLTSSGSFLSLSHPLIISTLKNSRQEPTSVKHIATVIQKPADFIEPTSLPTETPTPTLLQETLKPSQTPAAQTTSQQSQANPGGLNADALFTLVNNHRTAMGLPSFQKNDATCSLANTRSGAVGEEIAAGHMHAGFWANPHPGVATENIISMNSEQAALNWWLGDYIHRIAIEGAYTYSCIACNGNSCNEEFGS